MRLTRQEYCAYDSAITSECFQNLRKTSNSYADKLFETLKILMSNTNLDIDRRILKSSIEKLDQTKPIKTPKQVMLDLKYLKPSESYVPWKLQAAFNRAKSNEDKLLLTKHLEWVGQKQKLDFWKKLYEHKQNDRYIHDVIDGSFMILNAGNNSVTWRISDIEWLIPLLKTKHSIHHIHTTNLTQHMNVDKGDYEKVRMVWCEDLDRNFKTKFNMKKTNVEEEMNDKYPMIEKTKFNIMVRATSEQVHEWTQQKMKFSVGDEKYMFNHIWNQSVCEAVCDLVLDNPYKSYMIASNTLIELETI